MIWKNINILLLVFQRSQKNIEAVNIQRVVMILLIFQQYLKLYVQKIKIIILSSSPHETVIKADNTVGHKEISIIFSK